MRKNKKPPLLHMKVQSSVVVFYFGVCGWNIVMVLLFYSSCEWGYTNNSFGAENSHISSN